MFGRKVSTKDLFLIALYQVRKTEWDGDDCTVCYVQRPPLQTFATKKGQYYVDVFTGTKYQLWDYDPLLSAGTWVVREANPIIIDRKKVPVQILKEALSEIKSTDLIEHQKHLTKKMGE